MQSYDGAEAWVDKRNRKITLVNNASAHGEFMKVAL